MAKKFFLLLIGLLLIMMKSPAYDNKTELEPFEIGLLGDLPYQLSDPKVGDIHWQRLMWSMGAEKLGFVVHVGDIKSSNQRCDDDYLEYIRDEFQCFPHPWFYTPGDNEWTDCNKAKAGGYDPMNRLDKIRQLFTQGEVSFGKHALPLARQENFPENTRWEYRNIVFATLHVVGSDNGLKKQPQDSEETWLVRQREFKSRNAANLAWLKAAFARAAELDSPGMMLFMQANPEILDFNAWSEDDVSSRIAHQIRAHFIEVKTTAFANPEAASPGFRDTVKLLRELTIAFSRPVVLVHGDSHYFRIDKPMRDEKDQLVEHFTRVEVFGAQDVHWVRAVVDFSDPQLFRFTPEIVNANRAPHALNKQ